jgi:signal transduction histidine kinase
VLARLFDQGEEDRRRLARVLHNELCQTLAMVKLHLAAVQRQLGSAAPARLAECVALVQQAADQTRTLALEARPSLLDDLGLVPALRWCVQRHPNLAATVSAEPPEPALTPAVATVLYRVTEEAAANAARHAGARNLAVTVRCGPAGVDLIVRDDGHGFDLQQTPAPSLALLAERTRLAGGHLTVQSGPAGTEVTAHFPPA